MCALTNAFGSCSFLQGCTEEFWAPLRHPGRAPAALRFCCHGPGLPFLINTFAFHCEKVSIAEKRKGGIEQRLLTFVMFPAASLSPAPRGEGSSCCSRDAAVVTVWGKKPKKQKHFHEARSHSSHGFLHQRGAGGPVPPSPVTPVLPSHPQCFAALQFSL